MDKKIVYVLWVVVFIAVANLLPNLFRLEPSAVPFDDFTHYWAAGNLMSQGANPYDLKSVVGLRNELGQNVEYLEHAAIFLYPPWALPIVLPFGLLPYMLSRVLWLFLNISAVVFSSVKIWDFYGGKAKERWIGWMIVLTFFSTILVLAAGHLNPGFLLGFTGFVLLADKKSAHWKDLLIGAIISLIAIKFHLHYLILVATAFWLIQEKRWMIVLGAGITTLTATFIAFLLRPGIIQDFILLLQTYPYNQWATPMFGAHLRWIFGLDLFWLQFVPPIIGMLWFLFYWTKNRKNWIWKEKMPVLLFVSILTAAYGWTGDFVILLLPLLQAAIVLNNSSNKHVLLAWLSVYVAINMTIFILHSKMFELSDFWFFWFSPVLFTLYLIGIRYPKQAAARTSAIAVTK
jgi:hypothetical protein